MSNDYARIISNFVSDKGLVKVQNLPSCAASTFMLVLSRVTNFVMKRTAGAPSLGQNFCFLF